MPTQLTPSLCLWNHWESKHCSGLEEALLAFIKQNDVLRDFLKLDVTGGKKVAT